MTEQKVTVYEPGPGSQQTVQTAGMRREEVISAPGVWVGRVYAEPDMASGWHHHGEHDTYIYAVSGRIRLEFGPGGREVVEARPGTIAHVPKGVIHRESNPGHDEAMVFLVRVGAGVPAVNVDGPAR